MVEPGEVPEVEKGLQERIDEEFGSDIGKIKKRTEKKRREKAPSLLERVVGATDVVGDMVTGVTGREEVGDKAGAAAYIGGCTVAGAAAGIVVPGLGNLVGAGAGAVFGTVTYLMGKRKRDQKKKKEYSTKEEV